MLRITLEVNTSTDMTGTAITTPSQRHRLAGLEDRSFESLRSHYECLPKVLAAALARGGDVCTGEEGERTTFAVLLAYARYAVLR